MHSVLGKDNKNLYSCVVQPWRGICLLPWRRNLCCPSDRYSGLADLRGIPYWSPQCLVPLVSLAIPGSRDELYQLQLWSFVVGNYLGVNLHIDLLKVVQALVHVVEPTKKAGEILEQLGCAPAATRV